MRKKPFIRVNGTTLLLDPTMLARQCLKTIEGAEEQCSECGDPIIAFGGVNNNKQVVCPCGQHYTIMEKP